MDHGSQTHFQLTEHLLQPKYPSMFVLLISKMNGATLFPVLSYAVISICLHNVVLSNYSSITENIVNLLFFSTKCYHCLFGLHMFRLYLCDTKYGV